MPQATTLEQALDNLRNEPLDEGTFSDFFIDTTEQRGGDEAFPQLKRDLFDHPLGSKHYLFTGSKGCGKSTELQRLKIKLENTVNKPKFLVASFSVKNELEPFSLTHIDLLIATMKKLFEIANDNGISIDEDYLKPIVNWTEKIDIKEKTTTGTELKAEAGVKGGLSFGGLVKIFTKLTAQAKYDKVFSTEVHSKEEHLISELIESSNILITEIKNKLQTSGKGLLVIIEDLDKLDIKRGEEIFFNYVSRLVALNVNTIYTFPISLNYNSRAYLATSAVDATFVLPMIKTHAIDGSPYLEGGQNMLKDLLEKRMNLTLFENDAVVNNFIKYSGGVIIDLFRMVKSAANFALNRDRTIINEADWNKALSRTIDDYRSMISDRVEDDKVVVGVKEYYDTLVKVAQDTTKQPNNTREELELRQNLCLLSYNDKGWIDVHPIVKEILIEKNLINGSLRIR